MAGTGDSGPTEPPRTLAEKLSWLRAASQEEKTPSWNTLANRISEATGVPVSGQYLWELGTDQPGTNVSLRHLTAFAQYFGRRISYFVDDEVAFEDDTQAQLALLKELSRLGIQQIRTQNVGSAPHPGTVTALLGRLQTLDVLSDEDVRALALRASALPVAQREALSSIADQPALLEALPRTLGLLEATAGFSEAQVASVIRSLSHTGAVEALQDEDVRQIAERCRELLPSSKKAILSMIEQLDRLENGQT